MEPVDRAYDLIDAGWYVFPLAFDSKVPLLKSGYCVQTRPSVALWAQQYITKRGDNFSMSKGGSYWATRDKPFAGRLFTGTGRACRVGIASDLVAIDIDHRDRVPDEMWEILCTLMPHCDTPGGGTHFFARKAGEYPPLGTFRTTDGSAIGEVKHCQKMYTVGYDGVPEYGACTTALDSRIDAWLRQAHTNRVPRPPVVGVGGGISLRPGTFTDHDHQRVTPLLVAGVADGRHDLMLIGTAQDARAGMPSRADEWVDAMLAAGTTDRDSEATIRGEVERAIVTAVEKYAPAPDTTKDAQIASLKAMLVAQAPVPLATVEPNHIGMLAAAKGCDVKLRRNDLKRINEVKFPDTGWLQIQYRGDTLALSRLTFELSRGALLAGGEGFRIRRSSDFREALDLACAEGRTDDSSCTQWSEYANVTAALPYLPEGPVEFASVKVYSGVVNHPEQAARVGPVVDGRVADALSRGGWVASGRRAVWFFTQAAGKVSASWTLRHYQHSRACWVPPAGRERVAVSILPDEVTTADPSRP